MNSVDVSLVVEYITQDKYGANVRVSVSVKYLQDIVDVKKNSPAILVNVPASVIRIVRLGNTLNTLNA